MTSECRNGHPRTEENTYRFPGRTKIACKVCRRKANARHQATPHGTAARRRAQAAYWLRGGYYAQRKRLLTHQRERILSELDRLTAEEAEWLRSVQANPQT